MSVSNSDIILILATMNFTLLKYFLTSKHCMPFKFLHNQIGSLLENYLTLLILYNSAIFLNLITEGKVNCTYNSINNLFVCLFVFM